MVKRYILARCAVCGALEGVDSRHREEHFAEVPGGIWIHLGACLAIWEAADDDRRTDWSIQAVRWRDAP